MAWKWYLEQIWHSFRRVFWIILCLLILTNSTVPLRGQEEQVRSYTRSEEFDFASWTIAALGVRFGQASTAPAAYMSEAERSALVRDYFARLSKERELARQLELALADPEGQSSQQVLDQHQAAWEDARRAVEDIQPTVESIMQEQVAATLVDLGFGVGGKVLPPVSFKFTTLPLSLIISPREVIRREQSVSLQPGLSLEARIALEEAVAEALDVSTLVENVGGIGTYPTMVLESTSLVWLFDVITHEWVHNYLTFRPLGLLYEASPELRTMNETTASILGREIGLQVVARYYPDLVPPPPAPEPEPALEQQPEPPAFDFREQMYITRLETDRLLAEGKVEQAEAYMEARRQVFWEQGYRIRKLNQAYFAFHGAYAATPEGAAGDDPVGGAVRTLWDRIQSPRKFLETMAWMNEFGDLERALNAFDANE